MSKATVKGFIAGMAVMALIGSLAGSALASFARQSIAVDYCDIQIVVDGEKLNPADVNGTPVEPFAYKGTTFLPVRAVASACGYEVEWDQDSYTVKLTKRDMQSYINEYREIGVPVLENVFSGAEYKETAYLDKSVVYTYAASSLPEESVLIDGYESWMMENGYKLVMSEADENNNTVYTFENKATNMNVTLSSSADDTELYVTVNYGNSNTDLASNAYQ